MEPKFKSVKLSR